MVQLPQLRHWRLISQFFKMRFTNSQIRYIRSSDERFSFHINENNAALLNSFSAGALGGTIVLRRRNTQIWYGTGTNLTASGRVLAGMVITGTGLPEAFALRCHRYLDLPMLYS